LDSCGPYREEDREEPLDPWEDKFPDDSFDGAEPWDPDGAEAEATVEAAAEEVLANALEAAANRILENDELLKIIITESELPELTANSNNREVPALLPYKNWGANIGTPDKPKNMGDVWKDARQKVGENFDPEAASSLDEIGPELVEDSRRKAIDHAVSHHDLSESVAQNMFNSVQSHTYDWGTVGFSNS